MSCLPPCWWPSLFIRFISLLFFSSQLIPRPSLEGVKTWIPTLSSSRFPPNNESDLNQSLQDLFNTLQDHNFEKLPAFTSRFRQLLQYKIDPPLETIWVYSALVFHNSNFSSTEPTAKFSALKDLFQLISSYSASCNSLKIIVLMAPVIYHLHNFILEVKGFELRTKKEKKLLRDVKSFSASILGFMNVCCNDMDDSFDASQSLTWSFKHLVSIWIWDAEIQDKGMEMLMQFLPLLNEDIVEKLYVGGYGLCEVAGHVIVESFLLNCCLAFLGENPGKEFYREMSAWTIGSITAMRNPYFFDSLVRMLLHPPLPVASLLSIEDKMSLRKVLYDSVILPGYSFLYLERLAHLPDNHVKRLAMDRLVITHEAAVFFRKLGDQAKALSYVTAFSSSNFPSHLIKWVKCQIANYVSPSEPDGSSPKALLRWILDIENQGIKIFDDDMSRYHAKLVVDNSEEDRELSGDIRDKTSDVDLFYIDNKGEQEDGKEKDENRNESLSAAFVDAARSMKSGKHGGRKRKVENGGEEKLPKFLKYSDDSDDKSKNESEVENTSSNDE